MFCFEKPWKYDINKDVAITKMVAYLEAQLQNDRKRERVVNLNEGGWIYKGEM